MGIQGLPGVNGSIGPQGPIGPMVCSVQVNFILFAYDTVVFISTAVMLFFISTTFIVASSVFLC